MSILNFLMAAPAGADGQQGSNPIVMGVAVVLMIAIFYFFLIRPQKKQEKEAKKMLSELKKGDKIVTIGGIHGVVFAVKEATVVVKVDDGAKIEFTKSAIAKVVNDAPAAVEEEGPSSVNVVLASAGANKLAVIKLIKEITGLGLGESKAIADNGGVVKENVSTDEAKEMKAKFEEAGATVEFK